MRNADWTQRTTIGHRGNRSSSRSDELSATELHGLFAEHGRQSSVRCTGRMTSRSWRGAAHDPFVYRWIIRPRSGRFTLSTTATQHHNLPKMKLGESIGYG